MSSLAEGAQPPRSTLRTPLGALSGCCLTAAGLYLLSRHNYLLFHSVVEVSTVAVAFAIFLVVWNSREYIHNNFFIVVGVSYLFVGVLDMLHALGYQGMGVFPDSGSNLATQLWIVARYLQAASLLLAFLFLERRLNLRALVAAYAAVAVLFLGLIFHWKLFPSCFDEATGLTPFKKTSEFIICGAMLLALPLLRHYREVFDARVRRWIAWSLFLSVASELTFTTYVDPYGFMNTLGHLFKLASFFFMYKALIETGLKEPYRVLFKELKDHELALQAARDGLEEEVRRRTAELSESEKKFRLIAETIPDVFRMSDPGLTRMHYVSPAYTRIWGRTLESVYRSPQSFMDTIHPEDQAGVRSALNGHAAGSWDLEYRIVRPDGSVRNIRDRGFPVLDEQDNLQLMVGVASDTTRQNEMETEIVKQSILLDAFFTHTITPLVFLTPNFDFIRVNVAYARACGREVSDFPGHNHFAFYPKEENQAIFERVVRTKTPYQAFAKPFVFPDHPEWGLTYWDWTLVPICGSNGEVSFLVFSLKDVTKRREAEIALREREQYLRTVISNAPVILFATDRNGVLTLSEGAGLRGIGQGPGESVGTSIFERYHDHPEIIQAMQRNLSGESVNSEFEVRGRILNIRCSPVTDATGQADGVIGVALDVTEHRRTQEQLEDYREQLRHADRLSTVGQLASGVVHELGTPLNVVHGRAGMIARGDLTDREVCESAGIIQGQVERMTVLLRQLLDFARRGAPEKSHVEIQRWVESTLELLASFGEHRGIRVECTGEETHVKVEADPGQIRQVLMNLVLNAMHAMPRGGELRVGIRPVSRRPPGGEEETCRSYVCIDVRDEGCGISPEDLPRIFDAFFTTKEAGEGTGLGLSIALGIVREHGGWIDVESEPGKGSRFSVYLPFAAADTPDEGLPPSGPQGQ